jgi:hypothetical protein
MSDREPFRALDERVAEIERRLDRMDTAPPSFIEEWLGDTERAAFKLLLRRLELSVPGFSTASFREEFVQLQADALEHAFEAKTAASEVLRTWIEARTSELIDELIPTPARDADRP